MIKKLPNNYGSFFYNLLIGITRDIIKAVGLMKINWLKIKLFLDKKYCKYVKNIFSQTNQSLSQITDFVIEDIKEYNCNYEDYFIFHFYELSPKLKKTYLTYYQNEILNKKYNQEINKYVLLKEEPYPPDCLELSKLNQGTNTFNFLVLQNELISSNLTLTINEEFTITASINLDTGIIDYPGYSNTSEYEKNPTNNAEILWFKIPKWPRIKRLVTKEASKITNNKYLIFHLLLTIDGPLVISYQTVPYNFFRDFELPMALKKEEGILPIINKIERGNNNEDSNCH